MKRLSRLGPGILFAAAAVGVSHLVQSTRAGAEFGLGLLGVILFANLLKYPAFRFGTDYAHATGTSLLEGYRRQGRWALVLYLTVTVGTLFAVQAGVTVVTAGLLGSLLGLTTSPVVLSAALLIACGGLLLAGGYRWLVGLTRVLVAVLTVSTVAATALALPRVDLGTLRVLPPAEAFDGMTLAFVVALVGWMPSAIDVSVWQSIWTLRHSRETGSRTGSRTGTQARDDVSFDFHVGYGATVALAVCFVFLGAALVHGSGESLRSSPTAFATQVIGMYRTTLGAWSGGLVGLAAFAVMFSTTLTVLDGFPRALATLRGRFLGSEGELSGVEEVGFQRVYWAAVVAQAGGAIVLLSLLLSSLGSFIDFATTLSFLSAPVLAVLNHRAMHGAEVPATHRPAGWLTALSWCGIVALSAFSLLYLGLLARNLG